MTGTKLLLLTISLQGLSHGHRWMCATDTTKILCENPVLAIPTIFSEAIETTGTKVTHAPSYLITTNYGISYLSKDI